MQRAGDFHRSEGFNAYVKNALRSHEIKSPDTELSMQIRFLLDDAIQAHFTYARHGLTQSTEMQVVIPCADTGAVAHYVADKKFGVVGSVREGAGERFFLREF